MDKTNYTAAKGGGHFFYYCHPRLASLSFLSIFCKTTKKFLGDAQYKSDVDEMLSISYNLTDEQKMLAEFFDDKFNSLPASFEYAAQKAGLSTEEAVTMDLIGKRGV